MMILIPLSAGATGPDHSADWPTWRGDAIRSAYTPYAITNPLYRIWSRPLGQPRKTWPTSQTKILFDSSYEPVVAGKLVFVGSMVADHVTAYNTDTGAEEWRFYADGPVRFAPLVWRGRLFVASDDGFLYCLSAETGDLLWKKRGAPAERWLLGNFRLISAWPVRGAPVLVEEENGEGTLYFAASIWPFMGTFIHALDAETGAERWVNSGSGSIFLEQQHYSPAFSGVAPQGYLTAKGDYLLVSGGRTVPAAYNRHTGEFLYYRVSDRNWQTNYEGGYEVNVMGDIFYNNGCFYEIADGAPVTRITASSRTFVTRINNAIVARTSAGNLSWYGTFDPHDDSAFVPGYNLPAENVVTKNTNARKAHFRSGDRLFFSGPNGWLGAVNLPGSSTTEVSWSDKVDGEAWTMVPGDGKLFVVTLDGVLHAFGPDEPGAPLEYPPVPAPLPAAAQLFGPQGYAMLWGLGNVSIDRFIELGQRFHVVGIDTNSAQVATLRRELDDLGWYGRRIHLLAGDPTTMPLPPYMASMIEISLPTDLAEVAAQKAWHCLRPYDGVAVMKDPSEPAQPLAQQRKQGTLIMILAKKSKPDPPQPFQVYAGAVRPLQSAGASVAYNSGQNSVAFARTGALPGSATWTHENADVANTVLSQDELVKPPLGLLWFGGMPNDDILPRHGHGPSPQVAGGRLFIEGPDALRAVDVYTGRLLWQRVLPGLGTFYNNTAHQPGANEIGSNYVSQEDGVYVVYKGRCLRLDPATGDTVAVFTLTADPDGTTPQWGYIGIYENLLIAGIAPLAVKEGSDTMPILSWNTPYASSSTRLVVMDRHSGEIKWQREAVQVFRHNTIIAGNDKLFCIDAISTANAKIMARRGLEPDTPPLLMALDIHSGNIIWQQGSDVVGTWLSYSQEHDLLVETGTSARDRATDEIEEGTAVYQGSDGSLKWGSTAKSFGRPILYDELLFRMADYYSNAGQAFSLLDGTQKKYLHPFTDANLNWKFTRKYGCNTPTAGRHMLLFRSAAAGYYELGRYAGTGNWGGFKSGCTSNLIPADGVLSAPDYTRTCTCSYQNQCSLALIPMEDVEVWTYQPFTSISGEIKRLAINFGAPGDWLEPDGPLWLEYPKGASDGPNINLNLRDGTATYYCMHMLDVSGPSRQVTASGMEGEITFGVPTNSTRQHNQKVKLYFAEPAATQAGERVFDVLLQDTMVIAGLDLVAATGGRRRGYVAEFDNISATGEVKVTLRSSAGSLKPPVICGISTSRQQ